MSALRQALLSEEKHYNCCDDDTPYLMDHPSQSCPHSLEHTVEKCLTYIGGIFLSKDVCKQQPSRTILIKPKCQSPATDIGWVLCGEQKGGSHAATFLKFLKALILFIAWLWRQESLYIQCSIFCHISEQIFPWRITLFCHVQSFSLCFYEDFIRLCYDGWKKGHSRGTRSLLHAHFRVERNYVVYLETKS